MSDILPPAPTLETNKEPGELDVLLAERGACSCGHPERELYVRGVNRYDGRYLRFYRCLNCNGLIVIAVAPDLSSMSSAAVNLLGGA